MAGITKKERVDRILEQNAKKQASLGFDSTPEERVEANRFWVECLTKIFTIDPERAKTLSTGDELDVKAVVQRMVDEFLKTKDDEIAERVWYIFSKAHDLFPLEFVLECLESFGNVIHLQTGIEGWTINQDLQFPSVRDALTHYLNT